MRHPKLWCALALVGPALWGCSESAGVAPAFQVTRLSQRAPEEPEARVSLHNVTRPIAADASFENVPLNPDPGARIEFELGHQEKTANDIRVEFLTGNETRTLATQRRGSAGGGWQKFVADLPAAWNATGALRFLAGEEPADLDHGWALSSPRIYQQRESSRFNVLIITVDTLRADFLGFYGHDRPTSPNLDQWADESIIFDRAIAQAAWTLPSYSSMLTGLYGESHGVVHRNHLFGDQFISFVELFAAAGYTTAGFVSGTFTDSFWKFDQGFDSYDDLGMVTDDLKNSSTDPSHPNSMARAEQRITSPEVTDKAIDWLKTYQDTRFLLFAHYFDPHSELMEHPGFSEKFPEREVPPMRMKLTQGGRPGDLARLRALYEGEVAFTDHHIGRLLDALKDLGLLESTIVVLCADHGEEFFERSRVGHGHSLFNELVHVPFVMQIPGLKPRRIDQPVGNVDLGPTLLELCDVEGPAPSIGGESLVPLIDGEAAARSHPVLSTRFPTVPPRSSDDTDRAAKDWIRIDQGDMTYINVRQRQRSLHFLFSSSTDPLHENNLADGQSDQARQIADYYQRVAPKLSAILKPNSAAELDPEMKQKLEALGYPDTTSDGP